jgi:maleylpyruvate isomerase
MSHMTLSDDLVQCREAHARLYDTIRTLTDDAVRRPSLLPGWTVAHVLTHLARNADSVTRRVDAASRGETVEQYPGGRAQREGEIEAGAGRSAAELVDDVIAASGAVDAAFAALAGEVWDMPVRHGRGPQGHVSDLPFARWAEVDVHHVDLGLGYTVADWPQALVDRWLPSLLKSLPTRADAHALMAWTLGRGPAPEVAPF